MTLEGYLVGVMIGAVVYAGLVALNSRGHQGDSGPQHCRRHFHPKKHHRRHDR